MLFVLATLLLVLTVRSSPAARSALPASKRGLDSSVTYQGLGPLPFGTIDFDARSPQAENGQWFHYVDGGPGVGVSPGTQVGWRLTDEPDSEIVFYMTANPVFFTADYTGSDANRPNPVDGFANVGAATFPPPSNVTAPAQADDIWTNSTGATVVPWHYGLQIDNGCEDGRLVIATSVDANGIAMTAYGIDGLVLDPLSLPVNVTIYFQDSPDDVSTLSFFAATDALTYKVGAGPNQPTVPPATFGTIFSWCDTD
ncbi:hypothetical protein B0H16DRAFT_494146 [Mycena metata]|uniref:Uncharacterized protein n=1 Tax=Mycena metata TaxID=1033252 RepID=A0AAD7JFR5_9AGAR|nr:hypothetical protein B0H16DRAFT_494146 [Mycena metata]